MAIRWIDVTIPMEPGMTVWPGDTPFTVEQHNHHSQGGANTATLTFSSHTGTHIDAPWHFEPDGKRLHEIDHSLFFGPAQVIALEQVSSIKASDLEKYPLSPRVLFKTANSKRKPNQAFYTDFVALEPDAARFLVDAGVRLVGIDYLSIAPYKQPGQATHHILLKNDILVVEGVCLGAVPPGRHLFTVLPLALQNADGAPCRAFIGMEETANGST